MEKTKVPAWSEMSAAEKLSLFMLFALYLLIIIGIGW